MIEVREYEAPEVSRGEIIRYMRARPDESLCERLEACLSLTLPTLTYKAWMGEFKIRIDSDIVDFGFGSVKSRSLAGHLSMCDTAQIFVATVGIGIDRLMARLGVKSPADSLIVSAIGNERIESLCDLVSEEVRTRAEKNGKNTVSRFSPGYGDLDISFEREIWSALTPERKIGVTLTESMMLSPLKSVSAIIGIRNGEK